MAGIIKEINPGSIAEKAGLCPGDKIIEVNGKCAEDLIDFCYFTAASEIELKICRDDQKLIINIAKKPDENTGIVFDDILFDGVRRCKNACIFCSVDQQPPGANSKSLFKDDDYRVSYGYGAVITMTNLQDSDFKRIGEQKIWPLQVSIHATDGEIRKKMMKNSEAVNVMDQLNKFHSMGAEIYGQIVLCRGINDGDVLRKTLEDLYPLRSSITIVGVYPFGKTKYRKGPEIELYDKDSANEVLDIIEEWQQKSMKEFGNRWVFAADELYMNAKREFPADEEYEGYLQWRNGIGMVRSFIAEWENIDLTNISFKPMTVVCGTEFAPILKGLVKDLPINIVPIKNEWMGEEIFASGLLGGSDIINQLQNIDIGTCIVVPKNALHDNHFMDGVSVAEIENQFGVPVFAAVHAPQMELIMRNWK